MKYLFLLIALVMAGCQPAAIVRPITRGSEVDSVFYYRQQPVADPFLDSLSLHDNRNLTLRKTVLPLPAPIDPFDHAAGFRVQVFAGADSIKAVQEKLQAAPAVGQDSVYLFRENGLFKVQVGDYPGRPQAEESRNRLKAVGFTGAWLVQREINIPRTVSTSTGGDMSRASLPAGRFYIQLRATADQAKALDLAEQAAAAFSLSYKIIAAGQVYKVLLGPLPNRFETERRLTEVRNAGYPDAWIVEL